MKIRAAALMLLLTLPLGAEEYALTTTDAKGDVYATSLVVTPADGATFSVRGTVKKGNTLLAAPNVTASKAEVSVIRTEDAGLVTTVRIEPAAKTAVVTVTVEKDGAVLVAQRATVDI